MTTKRKKIKADFNTIEREMEKKWYKDYCQLQAKDGVVYTLANGNRRTTLLHNHKYFILYYLGMDSDGDIKLRSKEVYQHDFDPSEWKEVTLYYRVWD